MEILKAEHLKKTFHLSAKQQRLEKTDQKVKIAVDDLSFSAHQGEIYGLLGPNGAGKTTTLRMIATLIRPDAGDILVEGYSAVRQPDEVRARIGFLTSELKLEDFFTPNYLFDFFSELHHVPEDVRDRRKKELFEKFGIDRFAEVKVANLSTGMKQKASLVRISSSSTNRRTGWTCSQPRSSPISSRSCAARARPSSSPPISSAWWRRSATGWASSSTEK